MSKRISDRASALSDAGTASREMDSLAEEEPNERVAVAVARKDPVSAISIESSLSC